MTSYVSSPAAAQQTVTVDLIASGWIKDPTNPALNLRVKVRNFDPVNRTRKEATFYPLNRASPIVVQGALQRSTSSFTVLVSTQEAVDRLIDLFEPARTLYLQVPPESSNGPRTSLYFRVVGTTSISRIAQPAKRPEREIIINYVEVDADDLA